MSWAQLWDAEQRGEKGHFKHKIPVLFMHFEIVPSPTGMETILRQEEGKSANSCPHCDMVTTGFIFNLCSQFNREEEQKGWRKSLDRSQEWLNSPFLAVVGGEFISKQES